MVTGCPTCVIKDHKCIAVKLLCALCFGVLNCSPFPQKEWAGIAITTMCITVIGNFMHMIGLLPLNMFKHVSSILIRKFE